MSRKEVSGQLVDVISGDITPARVIMEHGRFAEIAVLPEAPPQFLLPGFIDAHIHIESSQLCPSRFAQAVVPHGTTAVVSDPHEIANVLGVPGIEYMLSDAEGVPLRIFLTVPSCVPATRFETSGASIEVPDIEWMLMDRRFVALGEVMDYKGVLADEPHIMDKVRAAKKLWRNVDGHSPGLVGPDLVKYINAGISTDHECLTADEAEEKYFLGMWIQVREGSASRDLLPLLPFAKGHECMLVSDDLRAADISNGHLELLLRKAVALGMSPIHAIRAVTAWPAWHYGLKGGNIVVGSKADLVVVDDLKDFNVKQVYIAGELVAEEGRPLFEATPKKCPLAILTQDLIAPELQLKAEGGRVSARIIEVLPDQIESRSIITELPVHDGVVQADIRQDVLLMAVVNRYKKAPPSLGFVKGFGLKRGAMASSVAHDSHNILVVGASPEEMARAVNAVSRSGGYAVVDGERLEQLSLDVAGLMSTASPDQVVSRELVLLEMLNDMGCRLPAPFMTLSFQSLLVVPELKMSDRGLFDTLLGEFVDPLL